MASLRQIANLVIQFTASGLGALQTGVNATMGAISRSVASVGRGVATTLRTLNRLGVVRFTAIGLGAMRAAVAATVSGIAGTLRTINNVGVLKPLTLSFGLLKTGAQKAWEAIKRIPSATFDLGKKAALAATATFAGLGKTIKDTADEIRSVDNLGQGLGLSFGDTAAFNSLARKFGVDVGSLRGGLAQFATQVAQVQQGSETTIGYFKTLGIDVNDASGKTKDFITLLGEVASAQKNLNGIDRTGILAQLFGEDDFARLSPLLNSIGRGGGSASKSPYDGLAWAKGVDRPSFGGGSSIDGGGLREALDREKKNGGAYTDRDLQAANRLRQALGGLANTWGSLKSNLLQTFGPPFIGLINIASATLQRYRVQIVTGLANAWNAVILPIVDVFALLTVGYAPNGTWVVTFAEAIREIPRVVFGALRTVGDLFKALTGQSGIRTGWVARIAPMLFDLTIRLREAAYVAYDFVSALLGVQRGIPTGAVDRLSGDIADLQSGFKVAARGVYDFLYAMLGFARKDQIKTGWIREFYDQIRAIPRLLTGTIRTVFDFARALSGNTANVKTGWVRDFAREIGFLPDLLKFAARAIFDTLSWLKSFGPTISGWLRTAFNYLEAIDWSALGMKAEEFLVNLGVRVVSALTDLFSKGLKILATLPEDYERIRAAIVQMTKDVADAWAAGTPDQATTFWGSLAGSISSAVADITAFLGQLKLVFLENGKAEGSFAWLNEVKQLGKEVAGVAGTIFNKYKQLRDYLKESWDFDLTKTLLYLTFLRWIGVLGIAGSLIGTILSLFMGGGALGAAIGGYALIGGVMALAASAKNLAESQSAQRGMGQLVKQELDAGYLEKANNPKSDVDSAFAGFKQQPRGGYFASQDYKDAAVLDETRKNAALAPQPDWYKSAVADGVVQGLATASYMRPLSLDQAQAARGPAEGGGQTVNLKLIVPGGTVKIPTNESGLDAVRRSAAFTPGF